MVRMMLSIQKINQVSQGSQGQLRTTIIQESNSPPTVPFKIPNDERSSQRSIEGSRTRGEKGGEVSKVQDINSPKAVGSNCC